MACIGPVRMVGRLLGTPALADDGRICSLTVAAPEPLDVVVTGEAAGRCVGLRAGALVAVEGRRIGPRRLVVARVRNL